MKEVVLEDLRAKARRHQAGLLLDTQLLLLYLAYTTSDQLGVDWQQTEKQFTDNHVLMLRALVEGARRLVTTPHILTEASDLAGRAVPEKWRQPFLSNLRAFMMRAGERYVEARRVARDDDILSIGLADLAQAFFSWRSRPLVVTVDADVSAALEKRKLAVVNLNHFAFL